MPLIPGVRLGCYEVVSPLGEGGMGEVYRAHDTRLGREVAIKVLPAGLAADPERRARFEREARALAALNHPNVATLFGFETARATAGGAVDDAGEIPFLAMELVEGPTLADRIAQGPIPWPEAARLFLQIAQGLEAAHERGIVHRDLKPANVKVADEDVTGGRRVKVLDFGLARAMETAPADPAPDLSHSPTLTLAATMRGEIMGTAGYMAPEQARGAPADKRADVWAFGVCLFEALTGRETFGGDTVSDRLASVLKEDPDWDALPRELPSALNTVLHRCLEKNPAERLRDIGEARIALARLLADPEAAGAPAAALRGSAARLDRRALAAVAAAGLLLGAGLGAFASRWMVPSDRTAPSAPALTAFEIGDSGGEPIADLGGVQISPDGRRIVYAGAATQAIAGSLVGSASATGAPLRVRDLGAFDADTRALAGTEGALFPFFALDSQWVGYFTGGGGRRLLWKVHVESGSIVPITDGSHPGYRADWLEDGSIVIGEQRATLGLVTTDGTFRPRLTELDRQLGERSHVHPEVLPGDRGIVFSGLFADRPAPRLAVWDRRDDAVRTVVDSGGEARWVDTGHLVYGLHGALYAVPFDLETLSATGEPRKVLDGVQTGSLGEASFDVARDGTLVYLPGEAQRPSRMRLLRLRPDGAADATVVEGDVSSPVVSRDGRRWVVMERSELLVFDQGSPLPLRISIPSLTVGRPVFLDSGDEALVTYWSDRRALVHRVDLRTGALAPLDTDALEPLIPAAYDVRRNEVIAQSLGEQSGDADVDYGIVAVPLAGGGEPRTLLDGPLDELMPALSPAGDLLVWVESLRDHLDGTLYAADYPGLSRRLPLAERVSPAAYAFAPDGSLWFNNDGEDVVERVTFANDGTLRIATLDRVFETGGMFWGERGMAIDAEGRILVVEGAREFGGRSGRLRVIRGWVQSVLGSGP